MVEVTGDRELRHEDRLVTEEPLEIRLEWPGAAPRRGWVTMRTPGHDFELAAGWARHEGVATEVSRIAYCTDAQLTAEQEYNVVTLTLGSAPASVPHQHTSVTPGSSACGVCGRDSLSAALPRHATRWEGPELGTDVVRRLPAALRARQSVFDRTGGLHAAGLADSTGELLVIREDVGRHNAVDKVTGARMLTGAPTQEAALVVSGRAGFEIVQKALAAGIGTLVAVGAPTSLAVDLARAGGLSLYGFTSEERTVRYV